jgi:DNA-binding Xre family transcriptional regulator
MPTMIDIESARQRWEAKYNRSLSDDELVEMATISLASLSRMRSGRMHMLDLPKILKVCKALECDAKEIVVR